MTASPARRQHGAALLALAAVIIIGGAWFLLYAIQPANRVVLERDHNAKALRAAKEAVLGWVVKNAADPSDWNPGKLPCPEALGNFTAPPAAGEGVMQGFCAGAPTAVGRIPWKSLGIDKPYDVSGEVLWYVVSPGWKVPNGTSPEAPLGLNSNSLGGLTVDGVANAAVAAIIAPGRRLPITAPLASQTAQGCTTPSQFRTTFPPPDSTGYLECMNVAGATLRTGVVDNGTNEVFNDQVVLITAADVMAAIEPIIAKRIENTVVPQLQSAAYDSTQWNSNSPTAATVPAFPFAVSYASQTVTQYKGVAGTTQGLLPVVATTSNAVTAGRNDATFVAWDTASVSVVKRSGTATMNSAVCTASTTSQVQCSIDYSRTCNAFTPGCLFGCTCSASIEVSVLASANNVGNSLRTFTSTPITGFSGALVSSNTLLTAAGAASGDFRGNLATDTCTALFIFGILFPCTAGNTITVRVPITVFPEHPFVNPTTADAWYWFLANNWHQVTYYAVSQDHVPGGVRNCTSSLNCLNVSSELGTPLTNRYAILALAGRSVTGTTGANRVIGDFLDTTENTNFNSVFEQKRFSKTFNDRFVNVSP